MITSYRYTHYDSSDAGGSYSNMISVRLNDRAALVIRNYG